MYSPMLLCELLNQQHVTLSRLLASLLPNNSYDVVRYVKNVGNVFRGFSETVLFEKILEIYSCGLATAAFM